MGKFDEYMSGTIGPLAEAFGGGVGRGMTQEQEFRRLIENQMRAFEALRPMRKGQRAEELEEEEGQIARQIGRKRGPAAAQSYRAGTYRGDVAEDLAAEEANLPAFLRIGEAKARGELDIRGNLLQDRSALAEREGAAKQQVEQQLLPGELGMEQQKAEARVGTKEKLQPRELAIEDLAAVHVEKRKRDAEKVVSSRFAKVVGPKILPYLNTDPKNPITMEDLTDLPLAKWDKLITMYTSGMSQEERTAHNKEMEQLRRDSSKEIAIYREKMAEASASRAEAAARSAESSAGRRDIQSLTDLMKLQGYDVGGKGSGTTEAPAISEAKLREETYKDLQRQIATIKGSSRIESVKVPPEMLEQAMEAARAGEAYKVGGGRTVDPRNWWQSLAPEFAGGQAGPTDEWDLKLESEGTPGGRRRESARPGAGPGLGPELRKSIEQKTQDLIKRVVPQSKTKKEK